MYSFEDEYNRITDETMKKACDTLTAHHVPFDPQIAEGIGTAICEGTLAALHAGENCFSYKVAEQRAKLKIEGDNPPDCIGTHYYWVMRAGFAELAEAEAYITALREQEPGTQYGLFVDGIPIDYE